MAQCCWRRARNFFDNLNRETNPTKHFLPLRCCDPLLMFSAWGHLGSSGVGWGRMASKPGGGGRLARKICKSHVYLAPAQNSIQIHSIPMQELSNSACFRGEILQQSRRRLQDQISSRQPKYQIRAPRRDQRWKLADVAHYCNGLEAALAAKFPPMRASTIKSEDHCCLCSATAWKTCPGTRTTCRLP